MTKTFGLFGAVAVLTAAFLAFAAPAAAQTQGEFWKATLTANTTYSDANFLARGCNNQAGQPRCDNSNNLSVNTFTYEYEDADNQIQSHSNEIKTFVSDQRTGVLELAVTRNLPTDVAGWTLHVGGRSFSFADATISNRRQVQWSGAGVVWTEGQTVAVALSVPGPGGAATNTKLQKTWLSRFGRTVADHVTGAVSGRLSAPPAGGRVTVAGRTAARPETEDDARPSPPPGPARGIAGRELLSGGAFHLAKEGDGGEPGFAAWGRVTAGGFDGKEPAGATPIDGDVTTGTLGADAEWNRLLAGAAVSVSRGKGAFGRPGAETGTIKSRLTMVSPYARVALNERVSAWGLAGYGTGDMTIVRNANAAAGQPERRTRTDLSMRLAALGGRGALLDADETGGFDLALRADGFYVRTTSEAVPDEDGVTAHASRARVALEGSRAFKTDGGGVLTPGLELGLRRDGGDAETGMGVELGGRVSYTDPETGFGVEARLRRLVAHKDSDYREWGASGAARLSPDERGRGLSFSLAPAYGAPAGGADRLWPARSARDLTPGTATFEPESRLEGELGYGLPVSGGRFTGTPNLGFGLTGAGARDYRIGWRLTSAERDGPGVEVNLDATRRETANGAGTPGHGVMLRGAVRW